MKYGTSLLLLISLVSFPGHFSLPCLGPAEVFAEEAWRAELDELCSRSNSAMNFSRDELKMLIERCDKLKPQIDALDESTRKVYGRRLKMCRDFYAFMLESRKESPPK